VLITEQLVSSLARMRDRAVYYGHKATPRLLASALLSMPKCTGVRLQVDARHKILDLRIMMSEAELANYLGVTQQTVSRVLANLKADGIVSMQSRRLLTIRDRDKLERLAAGDKYRPHPSCFYGEDHRAETRSNTGVQK
jgi:CRP-like cAMP-binding protein